MPEDADTDIIESNPQPAASGSNSHYNRNPTGKNQHKDSPSLDDPHLQELIRMYHREGTTGRAEVSRLLRIKHGIQISATSVKRCRAKMGLYGSGVTTRCLPEVDKRQLVLDQMAKHPTRRTGPRTLQEDILHDSGIHLTRDYVESEMRVHDPEGFKIRDPNAKKVSRSALVVLGPHYEWSGDGHDKLAAIGFPLWGIRDVWSGKWLGLWVVPNNRLKVTIAYLYLSLIEELGGMPIQMTTDCGSENTQVYAFGSALRETFSPELPVLVAPAHRFLKSIHNTTIERGWLRLRLNWGDDVKVFWDKGDQIYGYNSNDPNQHELVQWLWPKLIQKELDALQYRFNNHKIRKDKRKKNPSGVTPNRAMDLPADFGGISCLQGVPRDVIRALKEELGGESLLHFVGVEYATRAQTVLESLDTSLTLENVWDVFQAMMPLMYCSD